MLKTRAPSAALFTGLALLLGSSALVAPGLALAQEPTAPPAAPPAAAPAEPAPAQPAPAPAPEGGVVSRILVQGNERIESSTVVSYLPIQPGETIDAAKIDLALKALANTGLFADETINFNNGDLVVTVVENPIINRVIFEGNKGIKEDKLRDEVTVRPRGIFTRAKVQGDVSRIVEVYRRSGRISATVEPQIIELPQKRVDLIFKIEEGAKSGVLSVNFLGNKAFSDNDLRDVVVTEESRWYKFFSNNANYDPDRLEYDKEQLRKHYRNRGYYDFRVSSAVAELSPDRNGFVVTYTIDEGPRYRFGKVEVETELQKLDKKVLTSLVPIRSGELYRDEAIEQATDGLTFAAGAAGFAFVDVRPRYTPDREKGVVDVSFQVREGPRVYVDRIEVVGNSQTLDYVIRREMSVVEGDAYNRALVDRSKRQIRALGFFKEVEIEETPGSAPDRTALRVQVEEQPTGELSFSAGYSSVDQLVLDLGITQRNFRGRGQDVRARISVGSLRQQLDVSFTEPRFLGRDLAAGLDIFGYRYDLSDFSAYETETYGFTLRSNFPLSLNSRGSLRYSLRNDTIEIDDFFCEAQVVQNADGTTTTIPPQLSSALCDQRGSNITSLLGYGARLDLRNDYLRPTRGWYAELNQDLAGLGGDVNYVRTDLEGGWYHGFNKDFILSVTGSAGYVVGWAGDEVRINDRYFKGGVNFRGFETAGIGPRDLAGQRGDALGGKVFGIGTVELTVPTFLPEQYGIKAALFSDFGTLGKLDKKDKLYQAGELDCLAANGSLAVAGTRNPCIRDDLSLRASAGISITWRAPVGPIQFDFSRVLSKEPYDKTETFRFSTATRF